MWEFFRYVDVISTQDSCIFVCFLCEWFVCVCTVHNTDDPLKLTPETCIQFYTCNLTNLFRVNQIWWWRNGFLQNRWRKSVKIKKIQAYLTRLKWGSITCCSLSAENKTYCGPTVHVCFFTKWRVWMTKARLVCFWILSVCVCVWLDLWIHAWAYQRNISTESKP